MLEDEKFTILLQDLQFAIELPPNHYLNTISRTYDKKNLFSPFVRRWVGDDRNLSLQFMYELIRRSKEILTGKYSSEKKELLHSKLQILDKTAKNLYEFYGVDNPYIRAKFQTFRDNLQLFLNISSSLDPEEEISIGIDTMV